MTGNIQDTYFSTSVRPIFFSVLCTFAKLQEVNIRYVMSVCDTAWNNSVSTRRIFMDIDVWVFFDNLSKKIQVSLKSDKNKGYFT